MGVITPPPKKTLYIQHIKGKEKYGNPHHKKIPPKPIH